MNIGDLVRADFEFKVTQIEEHCTGNIILSGKAEINGAPIFVRAPQASCVLTNPGVETVMRETYLDKPVAS